MAGTPHSKITIAPQALVGWERLPPATQAEIGKVLQHRLGNYPATDGTPDPFDRALKVGDERVRVRRLASGFRVVYMQSESEITVVAVLTPREAAMGRG